MRPMLTLVLLSTNVFAYNVPKEMQLYWIEISKPYYSSCMCATGADQTRAINFLGKLEFTEDPCLKCFAKCIMLKLGIMTSNGVIIPEIWAEVTASPLEFVKKCTNESSSVPDECEKTFVFGKCLLTLIDANYTSTIMRTILVLGLLLTKVLSITVPNEMQLHWIEISTPYYSSCMCATGVDQTKAINLLGKLELLEDPCVKCFGKCLMVKLGIMTSDGVIIPETWAEVTATPVEPVKKCTNESSSILDACEKTYVFGKCLLALI
ncbi:hypothetical protein FQR65_LT05718 [Abscondita terminalis]|nr:hypothetical protein FQR65_LT05718 [Abscondita terminalis]